MASPELIDVEAMDATSTATVEAAAHAADNQMVGRTVRKCFAGRPFIGTVVGYDTGAALYKVEYGDGDTEELSVHELRSVLLAVDAMEIEAKAKEEEEQRRSYAKRTKVGFRVLAGEGEEPSPALYDYHAKPWCTTWGELKRLGWTYKSGNFMGSYNGLPSDWCYLRPGAKHKTGVENRDFFYHEKTMLAFCEKHLIDGDERTGSPDEKYPTFIPEITEAERAAAEGASTGRGGRASRRDRTSSAASRAASTPAAAKGKRALDANGSSPPSSANKMLKVNGNGDATPGAGAAAAEDEEGPSLKQGQLIQFKWEDPTGWMGGVIVRKAKNYPQLKPPYIEVPEDKLGDGWVVKFSDGELMALVLSPSLKSAEDKTTQEAKSNDYGAAGDWHFDLAPPPPPKATPKAAPQAPCPPPTASERWPVRPPVEGGQAKVLFQSNKGVYDWFLGEVRNVETSAATPSSADGEEKKTYRFEVMFKDGSTVPCGIPYPKEEDVVVMPSKDEPPPRPRPPTQGRKAWREGLQAGDFLDAKDADGNWYEAMAIETNKSARTVRVHFLGWDSKYDETKHIDNDSMDILPRYTKSHNWRANIKVGNQVEMKYMEAPSANEKSAPKKIWYPASVVKVEEKKNLVHVCIPSVKGKHETTVEMICSENICQRGTHLTNRSWQKLTS